jgi:hypothetical protein
MVVHGHETFTSEWRPDGSRVPKVSGLGRQAVLTGLAQYISRRILALRKYGLVPTCLENKKCSLLTLQVSKTSCINCPATLASSLPLFCLDWSASASAQSFGQPDEQGLEAKRYQNKKLRFPAMLENTFPRHRMILRSRGDASNLRPRVEPGAMTREPAGHHQRSIDLPGQSRGF